MTTCSVSFTCAILKRSWGVSSSEAASVLSLSSDNWGSMSPHQSQYTYSLFMIIVKQVTTLHYFWIFLIFFPPVKQQEEVCHHSLTASDEIKYLVIELLMGVEDILVARQPQRRAQGLLVDTSVTLSIYRIQIVTTLTQWLKPWLRK